MLKFFRNILFFIPVALAFYVCILFLWSSFSFSSFFKSNLITHNELQGASDQRLKDLRNTKINEFDILVLGSSHAYRGFDPRIFEENNIKLFNLGTTSQTPEQSLELLRQYSERINPKLLIVEVYPKLMMSNGTESMIDLTLNDPSRYSLKRVLNQKSISFFNSWVYSNYLSFDEINYKSNINYIKNGFVESKNEFTRKKFYERIEWVPLKSQLKALNKIIAFSKNHNIKCVLVFSPLTVDYYNSYSNSTNFDREMNKIGDYYNFNKILNLQDTIHFTDYHHLNQKGVREFNQTFIELIKINGLLKN